MSSGNASYRCSMSSSADFSDDDDFSQKSGSMSPAPGDTLPWNLPRHERCKRKIQGGSVLDPAERAVLRIADERDRVQKKTFTKWINQHLMKVRKHVSDLYEDLRDGHNLISLLEVLSGDTLPRERDFLKTLRLPREKGRMRFHRLQNVQIALDYLKKHQVKLVNIRNDDITDGNPKLTLGLIWTIILHFQISDIHVTGESEDMSAKEKLLLWTQQTTEGYVGVRCENFTTCWRDGRLFNAIIHRYRPDLIDMNTVAVQSNTANLENAFFVAEKLGVTRLLDPEDVDVSSPDEKSVITYVSSLYDAFPKVPEGGEGISANDVEVKWIEYQNMVNYLIQWIRHHVTIMSDRTFPNNPMELKALYNQYLQFKETEIPPKETEKARIKHLYKLLEVWIEFGRLRLPQGYHPNDIEKEWGLLIIAMLEREKTLRPEVERLEMLQQIANRVHRDSLGCEDKLILARNALQSDAKRLESGLQFQNEAEIAGYLLECENLLRQQVIDVQMLLDGKYYQSEQLVQRVAKLRDELMALRTECSAVYSKGRTLSTEQTKLMISGITQSLNSGFQQNLNPTLNSTLTQSFTPSLTPSSLTTGLSHGFIPRLTSVITPGFTSSYTPGLIQNYVTGVAPGALQSLKLMQIRKPLMKSAIADQNLTEEEVNIKFVQDLLSWVEEMQVQLDHAEWGSDLPSVEGHLEDHKNVYRAVEEFESSLKEAMISEIQMTGVHKLSYSDKLRKLESQYAKLLNSTRNRERHLDTLHNFVSRATRELIWLNEKEEEEVAYDWSERNSNISRKKEYHAELMRELDQKEDVMKAVQDMADQLLLDNHPARLTIEAYRAAMQTQWSWILQLCHCVEQHLRENAAYFEFFNDTKESMDYLKNLKDAIQRKYSCDRNSSLHKLEDLVQESMEEKEQLLQYKSTVAGLVGRAKAIIQLKPRNPDSPLKASIPIKAICDYKQIEITIYKDDECILASNSHRAKWKVINPTGNEAMVPSVCFTVPPPNKEALDAGNRIEQLFQSVLALWHESHINMKSVVSWHYLMNEIETIRASNVASIKTMLPGEHQQVLSNLKSRFEDFLEDSQESKIFSGTDIRQLERDVNVCKQCYEELLKSAEREEQEESVYNLYVSEVRNILLRLENCEERLIKQIRTPLERDDLHESVFKTAEQEKLKKELDRLKEDLGETTEKCEGFFSQAAASPSVPTLRSELNRVVQNMNQVYSLSSIYLEKLKTINLLLKNTQAAESLVKLYETKLCEEDAVTADKNAIDTLVGTLKQWRLEVDEKREVFHVLEDELQKAKAISDQMFKVHKERDLDFDWHREKADQLADRWQNVHSQIDSRLRDLDGISKSLKYYRETYFELDDWIKEAEETQRKIQEEQPANSKALAKQLDQQKMLVSEIEMKQNKIDECQKYSEQYSAALKDYELQLMMYRAMVDSHQKSPVKRRRMQNSSDLIIQEFMDLRTRYTALVTLMTQYVKFAGESLKRMEEEEKSLEEEKKECVEKTGELLKWVSNIEKAMNGERSGGENAEKATFSRQQMSSDEISAKQEQISEALQTTQLFLAKHGDKMTETEKKEVENQVKTLQEGYNLLSKESEKQLQESQTAVNEKAEGKVDKVIAGTIDQTTGEILSIFQSVLQGLIDYDTGLKLLETQLIVSGIISPESTTCFELEDAKNHSLVNEQIALQLEELSNAKKLISSLSSALPVVTAFEQGLISEPLALNILEIQLCFGCIVLPVTGEQLSLHRAFQRNLLPEVLFAKLLERQSGGKELIDPNTAERITLIEMVQRAAIHKQTGLRLFPVRREDRGKITLKSGKKISILRAAHEGFMDREILFRLLGAQLFSGGIIDPDSGYRLTLEEALHQGLIDQGAACGILSYQVQNGGILCPSSSRRLTVDEAVQWNLISVRSALLVLEAQRGFIGLIWPDDSEIFPVSTSLQQGMISNELAHKILNNRQKIAALYIPETSEILSLDRAAQLRIIDNNAASVLKNVILPDKMPNIEDLESSCKGSSNWMSSCEFQPSAFQEFDQRQDTLDADEPAPHNQEQIKQLFISYLMVHSYMDANTGQRLLLYDGDLEDAVGMLLEADNDMRSDEAFANEPTKTDNLLYETDFKTTENVVLDKECSSEDNISIANLKHFENLQEYVFSENMKEIEFESSEPSFTSRDSEQSECSKNASVDSQEIGTLSNIIDTGSCSVQSNIFNRNTDSYEEENACKDFTVQAKQAHIQIFKQIEDKQANCKNIDYNSLNDSPESLILSAQESKVNSFNMAFGSDGAKSPANIQNEAGIMDLTTDKGDITGEERNYSSQIMDNESKNTQAHCPQNNDETVMHDDNIEEQIQGSMHTCASTDIQNISGRNLFGHEPEDPFASNENATQQPQIDLYNDNMVSDGENVKDETLQNPIHILGSSDIKNFDGELSENTLESHIPHDDDIISHLFIFQYDDKTSSQIAHTLDDCHVSACSSNDTDVKNNLTGERLENELTSQATCDNDAYVTPDSDNDDNDYCDVQCQDWYSEDSDMQQEYDRDNEDYSDVTFHLKNDHLDIQHQEGNDCKKSNSPQLGHSYSCTPQQINHVDDNDSPYFEEDEGGYNDSSGNIERESCGLVLLHGKQHFVEEGGDSDENISFSELTKAWKVINTNRIDVRVPLEPIEEEESEIISNLEKPEQIIYVMSESLDNNSNCEFMAGKAEVGRDNSIKSLGNGHYTAADILKGGQSEGEGSANNHDAELPNLSPSSCIQTNINDDQKSETSNEIHVFTNIDLQSSDVCNLSLNNVGIIEEPQNQNVQDAEAACTILQFEELATHTREKGSDDYAVERKPDTAYENLEEHTQNFQGFPEDSVERKQISESDKLETFIDSENMFPGSEIYNTDGHTKLTSQFVILDKTATEGELIPGDTLHLSVSTFRQQSEDDENIQNISHQTEEKVGANEILYNDVQKMYATCLATEGTHVEDSMLCKHGPSKEDNVDVTELFMKYSTACKEHKHTLDVNQGKSFNSLQTITSNDIAISEKDFEMVTQTTNTANTGKEMCIAVSNKCPVHIENLGEIFDTSVNKSNTGVTFSHEEENYLSKTANENKDEHSRNLVDVNLGNGKDNCDFTSFLKQYTEDMNVDPSKPEPAAQLSALSNAVNPEEHLEVGDDLTKIKKVIHIENEENVFNIVPDSKRDSSHEFLTHERDISLDGAEQQENEISIYDENVRKNKLENVLDIESNRSKEDTTDQQLQKERKQLRDLLATEDISHIPHSCNISIKNLQEALKTTLKEEHAYCKQDYNPLNYSDTQFLVQSLLKMTDCSHLEDENFRESDGTRMGNDKGSFILEHPCSAVENYEDHVCLTPNNKSPDHLPRVLKQIICEQKSVEQLETDETHFKKEIQPAVLQLIPSQLDQIFDISTENEQSYNKTVSDLAKQFSASSQQPVAHVAEKGKDDYFASGTRPSKLTDFGRGDVSESPNDCVTKMKKVLPVDSSASILCSQNAQKLQEHLKLAQDMKFHLDNQKPVSDNMETLKLQLEQLESFESGLAAFSVVLRKDMKIAEEFLKAAHNDVPVENLKDLQLNHESLQNAFGVVCEMSSKRAKQIVLAIDSEMSKLAVLHQEHLDKLHKLSDWIMENGDTIKDFMVDGNDIEIMKESLQALKSKGRELRERKLQLETTALDIQFFISERAQDLSPKQSKQLLQLLNSTQKAFQAVQEKISSQLESLKASLRAAQNLGDQKDVAEQQQEHKEKLQEICDLLTQTENRLIGQHDTLVSGESTSELQHYQTEHQELQKDMQAGASELAEIVRNTEKFLWENRDKLSAEDKAVMEQKINEAKIKFELLSKRADESKRELEKAVTTAIKQEAEKVAAVEQLEESKNKIESLLDWISSVDKEGRNSERRMPQTIELNGTHFQEDEGKSGAGEEEEVNGNVLQPLETVVKGRGWSKEENLNHQYQKVKAQHEKIVSQHQAVIIATQSAQALLEKQGHHLAPEEKDKLQRNLKQLKAQFETTLAESERKMKSMQSMQEELEKFTTDCNEFENWLQQAKEELESLESGATDFNGVEAKLQRQRSFSEDVISHKGDLRYITISGQRVMDASKSCNKGNGVMVGDDNIDSFTICSMIQNKLDTASDHFKSLYSKSNNLGNDLKDLVDKYQHYTDISSGLLSGLQASEVAVNKQLSEPVAVDPKNLQRQLEETKILQGQISNHQICVEKLKKASEVLLDTRGGLLPNKDEIQKTLNDIVGRYDSLSKSVNDRSEKLQMTLTRSLSVQDGLNEMLDWIGDVERKLKEENQVPLNSTALQDIISKSIMLEQDITNRQSSINAIKEKMNKFMETADPSTASSLEVKMNDLSSRFSKACGEHKAKLANMEDLKTKVELFEALSEKVNSFLERKSQDLTETDGPGKDVTELSHYMQETNNEVTDHKKHLEDLQQLLEEISVHGLSGDQALVLEKVNTLSKKFKDLEEAVKEKEEDVSSCQSQIDTFKRLVESLTKWLESTKSKIQVTQPTLRIEDLKKPLEDTKMLRDEWTSKAPEIQKLNQKGTLLCNLISVVTSPAKSKARSAVKSGKMVLNGGESTSDAKGFLTNKELTAVQQDMSSVNHSYEDLGVCLKEKIAELELWLSKMQHVQEETDSTMQWLEKMDAIAANWETAPTDSEGVKSQVEQHKMFEAELKQNSGKVQELKNKVTELLEKNPDAVEAPKWKQMLAEIDARWKKISHLTADRQQKLEESSNYLTQFQTAETQLKQWLVEKELMASVLGPLSIEPNMLNTQKQQVQILLKEFDTRKPQYEQLNTAAQGILSRPGELPPSYEIVKEQLAAVAQKWDSLTGQLSDRCGRIDQAIVKSTQYRVLLRSLADKLNMLDNKLRGSLAVSAHPDAVKQQLETAHEVQKEIEKEMKNIEEARALCEDLSALVGEEYLKAELSRQLESILKPFNDIEQKAANHVLQLQSTYASSQQFQRMSKDFQAWLDTKRKEQNQVSPVSAKLDSLKLLIKEQTEIQKSLTAKLSSYEKIVGEAESLLQKTQGAEKTELQSQVSTLKNNWGELNKQVTERQEKLKGCEQKAVQYREHVESLQQWIDECQNKLLEIKVCIDPAGIETSVGQVKALQKNVDKHRVMVEMLNNAAENLLNASEKDKESVSDEKLLLNQQVDMIVEQLHNKKDSLDSMAQRFKELQECFREAKRQFKLAKEQLELHDSLGAQACSNKHLTIMQTQQKALQILKPQVDLAQNLAQGLVVDASDAFGVSDLLLEAESLNKEHRVISKLVDDKCSFLETKLQGIGHFQNSIREMFSQFAEFDDELDSMDPVGRDRVTLLSQKECIKNFLKKLGDLITNNENANKTCKMMIATEASPDLIGIKRDLEALSKQCNKLLDRAKAREEQVEGTISRIEEFYKKLKDFAKRLVGAEEHEESQGAVGMETDTINQQLNIFKEFQKEEIEPLQVQLQEVNWLGQGLIQSAAKSTNTQNIEHDLEDVNARWNTLNKKVAQRAAQLQEALLHCGRFQDALESLLSWLTDTEDLVANQKPPSAEFKVVKAQIQEQKLLQRLLDDRRPTVEVIRREGEKIAASAEPADKEKILKQLDTLGSRWDALLSKAETRNRQLEGISVVAEQFHETIEPLNEWLITTEKRLANSEPTGTQAAKLQQQLSQHKAIEDDIMAHNKHLHQAVIMGQSLKTMSSREDKDMVQEILDSVQARFIDVQGKSSRRCELLQQAHCNAQIFGDDEVELLNWLNEAHDKLRTLSVQGYNTDILNKQHTELLLLQEDIMFRKQNVDQAIQNGLELLKQTTGDEVVVIQEKLDGIKARYSEITKLSSDVSKVLDQALQLANRLQSTHTELCRWLDRVEMELLSHEAQIPKGDELSQAQERQRELKKEAKSNKGLLDSLNEVSSALLELVPWRAREGLDRMVTEDNERYRLVNDTITQKAEEIDAAILRSQQFEQAANAELAWLAETEKKLLSLGDIRLEQDQTTAQLQGQKACTMELLRHKDIIDELVASGDKLMSTCSEEEKQIMKEKLEELTKKYDRVCHLNSERNLQLERAHSLVSQFWETCEELWPWLITTETVISQLPAPALEYETLKQQQEELRQLRELIAEHKPHIDKMNKTGPQLLELSPGEGFSIQEKYVTADALYSEIKEIVKKRAIALDEAISQSSQFHDKIYPTLESLARIAERLRQPPSISAEVEKIKEQISENKNVAVELEKLQPVYEMLNQRGEEMIARSEGADKDISAKAVQDKLDQMVFIWEDIQALIEEREAKLLDVMELAEKFWCDHMALAATIKDTQDFIRELEEPGVDPSVVKQQQEAAEAIREEIDGLQEELDIVVNLGAELIAACGEPDKPVVNKSIDELNSAWDTLNKTWKERVDKLNDAMQAAVQYQDGLQAIFDWVDIAGIKLDAMPPVGTDLETVKQQIAELKHFKMDAYHQQIELERLNHQAELLLKKVTEESDKHTVQDPITELKLIWATLEEKIVNRQHKLEGALLALGQFQHALDELLAWLTHTEELLNEQRRIGGDPKAIEIELAKHHVLQNDVLAHQSTVETVKKAGNELIESSAGEEASSLHSKLEILNQRWQNVLEKTEQRRLQLDSALSQAQGFHSEIEDMQQWLTDTERQLLASKPVGGLPETAREQLNTHLELCTGFEAKKETYRSLLLKGQQLLARCPESKDTNVEQDINKLKEKWESVQTKLSERKVKLEEALNLATEFHNSLQDFINWLTQAEQTLTMASAASLVLDTVLFQIDEHKVFVTEVNLHREQIIELDKTGTHLKYFSQKQDVVLIKNLLISVQNRWENVVQRSVERGRVLDDARKRAKQFHEAFSKLMEWLEESENALDSELEIANDPDKIKAQLVQHKEFQKSLGAKHSVYDTTNRSGRSLKDKTTLHDDIQKLDDMLSELRDKWDTVCGKSVERQNKLEEALLFSGQFTDALQALIDWLYRVEPQLAEDQPVHGDFDLVMNLIDNHKVFQKELGKRTSSVQALKRSARDLIESSHDDSSWVKVQMQELSNRWETVCTLSVSKQTRLEQALRQAEEFRTTVHALLEWLAEAEQTLRFHGVFPEDEDALRALIDQHKEFMKKLEERRAGVNKGAGMGEALLTICHLDSITTIKHWITIIRARFEEVLTWAKQHQQRLAAALAEILARQELVETLLTWLQWAETTLNEKDKETIPQEIEQVKTLIAEHQTFMEEMTRKQPDVDKVTKTYKRKAAELPPVQSHIPVLDKGRTGRKRSATPNLYPSGVQSQIETKNPRVNLLISKWQQVWLLALERRRKLNDALDRLEELREFANFDFDVWRKKYMRWMNHKKSRVMDFFRRIDKDQDGKITRQEFIDGILSSKFPTSRLEMSAVADIFDRDGDGYIDYYEFVAALHPKDAYKPVTDADKIEDEVTRQVAKCKCAKRFQVEQIGDNKYRFFLGNQFGDSQQLRLVRILRSTVMVRVGGGWMALDEFLVKNDPCRVHHHGSKMLRSESNSSITTQPLIAKGRTNVELREKFMISEGINQTMAAFRPRGRRSRPSSRGASPNRSNSVSGPNIQPGSSQTHLSSTPKTPHHITRNYGKPWLTNSKTSTPCKTPEPPEIQGSSTEGTPIQGSKLRLPGYLSGKGFHSVEDSSLISTAATRVRAQFAESTKISSRPGSRPGSKAGSRSSSRRGSDASDFDISEIQSVCSDASEVVHDGSKPSSRAGSRPTTGKPSKIPTPQRRSPASKLIKSSKR
uniref:Dystonin n=1 Tax=Geotrypetes seraphini TaxID=260995 RepID=A0A6P8QXF8_GEOSA|nr:dystonin isoform X3 [Geotrypetes seraphini]